ncbi:MAG: fumarylacetoacetate hydrolase family protein [Devosia sp.]
MQDAELIDRLVAAHRNGTNSVDATPYALIDRETAYRVQTGVLSALAATPGMLKTAVHPDGVGAVAPIYASNVGYAPDFRLVGVSMVGLEVEVGIVLGKDLSAGADAAQAAAAIDHYFLGVEICGSRFPDRKAAGPMGGMADNMSGLGYAIGPTRKLGAQIDGIEVRLEFAGKQIHAAPAKHAFGNVLASLVAYANAQHPAYPLKAGTIVTTGSMCGLVAASGPGHVVASFGDDRLEFDIV